MDVAAWSAAGG